MVADVKLRFGALALMLVVAGETQHAHEALFQPHVLGLQRHPIVRNVPLCHAENDAAANVIIISLCSHPFGWE